MDYSRGPNVDGGCCYGHYQVSAWGLPRCPSDLPPPSMFNVFWADIINNIIDIIVCSNSKMTNDDGWL